MAHKITKAMRDCLVWYRQKEHDRDRLHKPPYTWTMRQVNIALERDWLCVRPNEWHILTDTGRLLLETPHEAL